MPEIPSTYSIFSLMPLINIFFAITVIFLERRNISSTWAWLMVLLVFPILGFILYILFGQNLARQKIYKYKCKDIENIQKRIKQQSNGMNSRIFNLSTTVQKHDSLIHLNQISNCSILSQNNKVTVFTNGEDKFNALINAIKNAKNHVHMFYYMFKNDLLGKRVLHALIDKANEGVEVKVVFDAIGSSELSLKFFQDLIQSGGKAFSFFPSKLPFLNHRINYRNHRKIAVIDGVIGFIGGINIGDEYLGLDPKIGFWRDTHLMIEGDAVKSLQTVFLLDWNVASNEDIQYNSSYFPTLEWKGEAPVQIISSGPHSDLQEIKNAYLKMIFSARESIYIQTPYFIPDESVLNALKIAAYSGVEVRIMIPKKADYEIVHWASMSYMGEMLNAGIKCYLYKKGFLHSKTMVVDGEVAAVGTTNIDNRSFKLNFEISALIYDKSIACELKNGFDSDIHDSQLLATNEYTNRSNLRKIKESFSRLLSPLL